MKAEPEIVEYENLNEIDKKKIAKIYEDISGEIFDEYAINSIIYDKAYDIAFCNSLENYDMSSLGFDEEFKEELDYRYKETPISKKNKKEDNDYKR